MTDLTLFPEKLFFQELEKRWKQNTLEVRDIWLILCGLVIRIRFADSQLRTTLTMPFTRLVVKPQKQADLTILAGSGDTLALPELPFPATAFGRRCELMTAPESGIEASFMMGPDILSMLDHEHRTAIYWIRDGGAVPAMDGCSSMQPPSGWMVLPY